MISNDFYCEEKLNGGKSLHKRSDSMQDTICTGHSGLECNSQEKLPDKAHCKLCEILRESEENEMFIVTLEFGSLFLHWNQSYLGRCLYISNTHVDNFPHIDHELFTNLNREMVLICKVIEEIFKPTLINFASLGNTIKHFHYHIIPRYKHDPNWGRPPWPAAEKELTRKGYEELTTKIRTSLEGFYDQKNKVSIKTY